MLGKGGVEPASSPSSSMGSALNHSALAQPTSQIVVQELLGREGREVGESRSMLVAELLEEK